MTPTLKHLAFLALLATIFLTSCRSHQELIYFQNLENYPDSTINIVQQPEPILISFGDELAITVYSFDPRAAIPFNTQSTGGESTAQGGGTKGIKYLVDEAGAIDFPVLGRVIIAGLSQREAEKKIAEKIKTYIKEPVVDVQLVNFKVMIIGETGQGGAGGGGGIIEVPNNKLNIIEAIARAGDISIYGDRTDILIIREEQGKRKFARVDITDTGIFNSPFYHLKPNDVIYLEPDEYKTFELNRDRVFQQVSLGTTIFSIITLLIAVL